MTDRTLTIAQNTEGALMTTTSKPNLIRDPAEWARQFGWVSGLRARRAASRLRDLAESIRNDDEGAEHHETWARELESVAKYLAPKKHVNQP